MPLTIDHRNLPEDIRDEILSKEPVNFAPPPGGPPDGEKFVFMMPEPEIDWPEGAAIENVIVGGVEGVSLKSAGAPKSTVLMHIHGGGFSGGSPSAGYRLFDAVKREFEIDSYSVQYTLAPEKKAPYQVNECYEFYKGLLDMGFEKIVLAGESAGGNLAIALSLKLKQDGIKMPVVVVSASGALDFTQKIEKPVKDVFSESFDSVLADYIDDIAPGDPLVSPIYGDFTDFPPLLLQTGDLESLKYDSMYLAELLEDTNCDCTLSIWEGAMHAFGIDPGDEWINREALKQIVSFIGVKAGLK